MNNATSSRSLNLKGITDFATSIGIRSQIALIIKKSGLKGRRKVHY